MERTGNELSNLSVNGGSSFHENRLYFEGTKCGFGTERHARSILIYKVLFGFGSLLRCAVRSNEDFSVWIPAFAGMTCSGGWFYPNF